MHGNSRITLQAQTASRPGIGMRNLFRTPDPLQNETFTAHGLIDKRTGEIQRANLHARMKALSARMLRTHEDFWASPVALPQSGLAPPGLRPWENPNLPSGYTYLLQFIAHDMMDSVASFTLGNIARPALRNARLQPLMLDTLYGAGPEECPLPYETSANHRASAGLLPRTHLRVGKRTVQDARSLDAKYCPFRDVARIAPETDNERASDPDFLSADTLLADPRNDIHALMSQMTLIFHLLHNDVMSMLVSRARDTALEFETAYRRFLCARCIVTLIYQNIVENDVLRRILYPEVYHIYATNPLLKLDANPGVPLEFANGAFRFGHALVRDEYTVNGWTPPQEMRRGLGLSFLSAETLDGGLDGRWSVDWSKFFGPQAPNLGRRIGPEFSNVLNDALLFAPRDGQLDHRGLANRDFVSACYAGMWSVPALIAETRSRLKVHGAEALVPSFEAWKEPLRLWLDDPQAPGLSQPIGPHLEALVEDPPLPFFILFEAAHEIVDGRPVPAHKLADGRLSLPGNGGQHLGPLGSIIVAESMFGALRACPFGFPDAAGLGDRIKACCDALSINTILLTPVIRHSFNNMLDLFDYLDQRQVFERG
jgi:hypothetical protein